MTKYFKFLALFLLIFLASCGSKTETGAETIRIGTEAISLVFLPNNPPNEIKVSDVDENFLLVMQLNNRGAYPQPDDTILAPEGKIYLSGFDKRIISFAAREYGTGDKIDIGRTALEGKSTINPHGGQDIITFDGKIDAKALNVNKYDPIIMATACFKYETIAAPQVCLDPIPYAENVRKVCTTSDVAMQSQGAPIAVTMLNVEPFAAKTQFKITVKNVGTGQVFKETYKDKCGEEQQPNTYNEDIDRVKLEKAEIAGEVLFCGPFANEGQTTNTKAQNGYIRLISGEGYVICELESGKYKDAQTPFTTPMEIKLSYTYKVSIQRQMTLIKKSN